MKCSYCKVLYLILLGGGGGGLVALLITEDAVGTGPGHFESLDCSLKVEAALML
jgi:hypothetical protein